MKLFEIAIAVLARCMLYGPMYVCHKSVFDKAAEHIELVWA